MQEKMYVCYLLKSTTRPVHTYVGITVDLHRRLRQHNGELKGGARRTRGRTWECVLYVYPFHSKRSAMQFERRFKKKRGLSGRLAGVGKLLAGKSNLALHTV
jgi:structure-specific endonuclease subunit SLX1